MNILLKSKLSLISMLVMLSGASASSMANNLVETINVKNDIALFTTTEAKPSCVNVDNEAFWTTPINDNSGTFELLMVSKRSEQPVELVSAQNCNDSTGYEKVASVAINYPYDDVTIPQIASSVNFVARTQVDMLEGEAEPSVKFELLDSGQNLLQSKSAQPVDDKYSYTFGQLSEGRYTLVTQVIAG